MVPRREHSGTKEQHTMTTMQNALTIRRLILKTVHAKYTHIVESSRIEWNPSAENIQRTKTAAAVYWNARTQLMIATNQQLQSTEHRARVRRILNEYEDTMLEYGFVA